jgi:hypothetical protein
MCEQVGGRATEPTFLLYSSRMATMFPTAVRAAERRRRPSSLRREHASDTRDRSSAVSAVLVAVLRPCFCSRSNDSLSNWVAAPWEIARSSALTAFNAASFFVLSGSPLARLSMALANVCASISSVARASHAALIAATSFRFSVPSSLAAAHDSAHRAGVVKLAIVTTDGEHQRALSSSPRVSLFFLIRPRIFLIFPYISLVFGFVVSRPPKS